MRKTVHKWFGVWEFDKEEQWLNEMAAKGLGLVDVGFCRYTFETSVPGEYSVRMELLENAVKHPESERYIAFVEETGAEHVGSWQRWVYFRKKRSEGAFELYSDMPSRIAHLTRILRLLFVVGGINIFIGVYNLLVCFLMPSPFNSLGIVNVLLGLLCVYGIAKIYKKRKQLKADNNLYE